jgi:hypothetical protein
MKPVHKGKDGWYFWDESNSEEHGPYPSLTQADLALKAYSKWLDGNGHLPQIPLSTPQQRREWIEETHAHLS